MPVQARLHYLLFGVCVGAIYVRFMPSNPFVRTGIVMAVGLGFGILSEFLYRRGLQQSRIPGTQWLVLLIISLNPLDKAAIGLGVPENWADGAMLAAMLVLLPALFVAVRRTRQQMGPFTLTQWRLLALAGAMVIVGVTIGLAASMS